MFLCEICPDVVVSVTYIFRSILPGSVYTYMCEDYFLYLTKQLPLAETSVLVLGRSNHAMTGSSQHQLRMADTSVYVSNQVWMGHWIGWMYINLSDNGICHDVATQVMSVYISEKHISHVSDQKAMMTNRASYVQASNKGFR